MLPDGLKILLFFAITSHLNEISLEVSVNHLFPFGPDVGDETLPPMTDGSSGPIRLMVPFRFFKSLENRLSVDVHGTLLFDGEQAHHTPDCSPVESFNRMIAVFWADIVTHEGIGGSVYYRQDTNAKLLKRATQLVLKRFPKMVGIRLKWLFVATWSNVTFYGAEGCQQDPNKHPRNTFQAILTTDGRASFAIFNYNKIVWTTSRFRTSAGNCSGLGGFPARVGFNQGDLKHFFSMAESCTDDIVNVDTTSNVNNPGQWVFRVDLNTSIEMAKNPEFNCNDTTISISPSFVDVFGAPVVIQGAWCLNDSLHDVFCSFHDPVKGQIRVEGQIQTSLGYPEVECHVPFFHDSGRIKVELEISDKFSKQTQKYDTYLAIVKKIPQAKVKNIGQSMIVEWESEAEELNQANLIDIELLQYQNGTWRQNGYLIRELPNSGKFVAKREMLDGNLVILRILRSEIQGKSRLKRGAYQDEMEFMESYDIPDGERLDTVFNEKYRESEISEYIFDIESKSASEKREACLRWHKNDAGVPSNVLLPCPPTLNRVRFDQSFEQDPCAYFLIRSSCLRKYNPGAFDSYLSIMPDDEGRGQQCTYSRDGNLLIQPPAAGTADAASPWSFFGETEHMERDVVPWIACCSEKDMSLCQLFYDKRPTDDGSRYQDPTVSAAMGDPHIVTFDRLEYTFNGIGEFWMVNSSKVKMQARMEPFFNPSNSSVLGSIFTAFVIQNVATGDKIQLQLSRSDVEDRVIDIYLNGQSLSFDNEMLLLQNFKGFSIRCRSSNLTDVTVTFLNGLAFRFVSSNNEMSVISTAKPHWKRKVKGLLGNYDGVPSNDLTTPNGTNVDPEKTSLRQIHFDFGLKWMVANSDSLFTYAEGESWSEYKDESFEPMFEVPNKIQLELPEQVTATCGDSQRCYFDYLATGGSLDVASHMAEVSDILEHQVEKVVREPLKPRCPSIKHPTNARVKSRGIVHFDGSIIEFECKHGFKLIGPSVLKCVNGTWSRDPPKCKRGSSCRNVRRLTNGKIVHASQNQLNFSCLEGYDLVGSSTIICQNGTWSAIKPVCRRKRPLASTTEKAPPQNLNQSLLKKTLRTFMNDPSQGEPKTLLIIIIAVSAGASLVAAVFTVCLVRKNCRNYWRNEYLQPDQDVTASLNNSSSKEGVPGAQQHLTEPLL